MTNGLITILNPPDSHFGRIEAEAEHNPDGGTSKERGHKCSLWLPRQWNLYAPYVISMQH